MFDLIPFITTAGYIGIALIIFAETGLLIGFFFPGDSLLFTAGFLASQDVLNIYILLIIAGVAAVVGDSTGYAIGKRLGPKIFTREDSLLFHKDHIERTKAFYEKHGGKTIIIARFLPVIRTFAPVLAGVGVMRYGTFLFYNIVGAILWAIGMPLLGYYLGSTIPGVDRYLLLIIVVIIILSVLPTALHVLRDKKTRDQLWGLVVKKLGIRKGE